jgi:phosphatidylglycerophosphate synthase
MSSEYFLSDEDYDSSYSYDDGTDEDPVRAPSRASDTLPSCCCLVWSGVGIAAWILLLVGIVVGTFVISVMCTWYRDVYQFCGPGPWQLFFVLFLIFVILAGLVVLCLLFSLLCR